MKEQLPGIINFYLKKMGKLLKLAALFIEIDSNPVDSLCINKIYIYNQYLQTSVRMWMLLVDKVSRTILFLFYFIIVWLHFHEKHSVKYILMNHS